MFYTQSQVPAGNFTDELGTKECREYESKRRGKTMKSNFYTVCIFINSAWEVSRNFDTVKAARNWAKWTAKKWDTKIYRGGVGGEVIA